MHGKILSVLLTLGLVVTASSAEPSYVRLVGAEQDILYRKFIPDSSDGRLQALREDPRLIIYDHTVMPPAHQDWFGPNAGVHDMRYNRAANPDPVGTPHEYPWRDPFGCHEPDCRKSVRSVRALLLPPNTKITIWRERMRFDTYGQRFRWAFPAGTVFMEILTHRNPQDRCDYPFEVRTRTLVDTGWQPQVYRPFARAEQLNTALARIDADVGVRGPIRNVLDRLRGRERLVSSNFIEPHPRPGRVVVDASRDPLPELPNDVVTTLLRYPFQPCRGEVWITGKDGQPDCHAPTTAAAFHIVPKDYRAEYFEVSKASCTRCHEDAGVLHAMDAQTYNDRGGLRDWYGLVRGGGTTDASGKPLEGGGILSFYPFALSSVSPNGESRAVEYRPEFRNAGLLQNRGE